MEKCVKSNTEVIVKTILGLLLQNTNVTHIKECQNNKKLLLKNLSQNLKCRRA